MWGFLGTLIHINFSSTMGLPQSMIPFMMGHFFGVWDCHMRCPTMGLSPQITPEFQMLLRV